MDVGNGMWCRVCGQSKEQNDFRESLIGMATLEDEKDLHLT